MMLDHDRVELAAKALARHRLGSNELTGQMNADLAHSILDRAVEQLWPQLREEAHAVVEALDGAAEPNGNASDDA